MSKKRIKFEKEILNQQTRLEIIQEIEGTENQLRKFESYKRYLCYQDQTSRFVVENLLRQLNLETVIEMRFAISNISIGKKIINKLARVYSNGVERTMDNEEDTKTIQNLAKELDLDATMKKLNRFLKLQKNVALFLKPCPEYSAEGTQVKWDLVPTVLQPHHYDVVEDFYDRTESLCHILSDYTPVLQSYSNIDPGLRPLSPSLQIKGNGVDEKIADTPEDKGRGEVKTYIWWSKNYHFTTDDKGNIIPDQNNPGNVNPFKKKMVRDYATDQDNAFWAEGGNDLIDGAILVNSMITHLNNIGILQSYGQFYMTGKGLPTPTIGPNRVIKLEYNKDEDPEPKLGFLNANPNLDSLRGCIEAYVALLLTTNNLSTSGVSAQLSGSKDLASGIALIIDKAESLEDVQDQRQVFLDEEPETFAAIGAFLDTYRSQLCDDLKDYKLPKDIEKSMRLKFNDAPAIVSEKEKLEVYKLREELGLDNLISLMMREDSTLDEKSAEKKLLKLIEQRMMIMKAEQDFRMNHGLSDPANPNNPHNPDHPDNMNPDNPNPMPENPDNPNPGAPGENAKSGGIGS